MNREVKMATIKISSLAIGGVVSLAVTAYLKKRLGV